MLEEDTEAAGGHDATCLKALPTDSVGGRAKPVNEQERRVDALVLRADERRNKLRKAAGRRK